MRHRQPTGTDEPEIRTSEPAPDSAGGGPEPGSGEGRKIDLSVPQVAGSALAAVIAAKLASTLGVYGTILGAGVISVVATCGGPLFQQLFKRTGEQVRDVTAAAKPKARQVPVPPPADDRPTPTPGALPGAEAPFPYDGEFGAATTHGTRLRGWKRPVLAAALVFGVTMGGITAYELVSGEDFSGTKGTTTFGSVVRGGGQQDAPERQSGDQERKREEPQAPAPTGSADRGDGQDTGRGAGTDAGTPSTGTTPDAGSGTPGGDATTAPTPDPTGSADGGTTPSQEPDEPTTDPTTDPTAPVTETPAGPTEAPGTGPALPDTPTAPAG